MVSSAPSCAQKECEDGDDAWPIFEEAGAALQDAYEVQCERSSRSNCDLTLPSKTAYKIQCGESSSGGGPNGTAAHPLSARSLAERVAKHAFNIVSARTLDSKCDPAPHGREEYEHLEEASDRLKGDAAYWRTFAEVQAEEVTRLMEHVLYCEASATKAIGSEGAAGTEEHTDPSMPSFDTVPVGAAASADAEEIDDGAVTPSEDLVPPSSFCDASVDPYLVQRQALRDAAREATLEDAQRARRFAEQFPSKTAYTIQCGESSSGGGPSGTAAHSLSARSLAERVAKHAFNVASARTLDSKCDPAPHGREEYEHLEEASDRLNIHLERGTPPMLTQPGLSQSQPPTSGVAMSTTPSDCGSSVSVPVRSSFAPAARRSTSSSSDASRASAAMSQGFSRKGEGGARPGLGTPTRRADTRRFECHHHVARAAAGYGCVTTSPCRMRGDGQVGVGSPLNSRGHPVGFGSSLSPSRVLLAASPARPTAGKRCHDT